MKERMNKRMNKLVRALHRYRRGHTGVRIPYKPDFFPGFLFTTAKVVSITAMIFFLIVIHISAVQIYDIHIFILSQRVDLIPAW